MPLSNFVSESKALNESVHLRAYAILDNTISFIPDFIIKQLLKIVGAFLKDSFSSVIHNFPT